MNLKLVATIADQRGTSDLTSVKGRFHAAPTPKGGSGRNTCYFSCIRLFTVLNIPLEADPSPLDVSFELKNPSPLFKNLATLYRALSEGSSSAQSGDISSIIEGIVSELPEGEFADQFKARLTNLESNYSQSGSISVDSFAQIVNEVLADLRAIFAPIISSNLSDLIGILEKKGTLSADDINPFRGLLKLLGIVDRRIGADYEDPEEVFLALMHFFDAQPITLTRTSFLEYTEDTEVESSLPEELSSIQEFADGREESASTMFPIGTFFQRPNTRDGRVSATQFQENIRQNFKPHDGTVLVREDHLGQNPTARNATIIQQAVQFKPGEEPSHLSVRLDRETHPETRLPLDFPVEIPRLVMLPAHLFEDGNPHFYECVCLMGYTGAHHTVAHKTENDLWLCEDFNTNRRGTLTTITKTTKAEFTRRIIYTEITDESRIASLQDQHITDKRSERPLLYTRNPRSRGSKPSSGASFNHMMGQLNEHITTLSIHDNYLGLFGELATRAETYQGPPPSEDPESQADTSDSSSGWGTLSGWRQKAKAASSILVQKASYMTTSGATVNDGFAALLASLGINSDALDTHFSAALPVYTWIVDELQAGRVPTHESFYKSDIYSDFFNSDVRNRTEPVRYDNPLTAKLLLWGAKERLNQICDFIRGTKNFQVKKSVLDGSDTRLSSLELLRRALEYWHTSYDKTPDGHAMTPTARKWFMLLHVILNPVISSHGQKKLLTISQKSKLLETTRAIRRANGTSKGNRDLDSAPFHQLVMWLIIDLLPYIEGLSQESFHSIQGGYTTGPLSRAAAQSGYVTSNDLLDGAPILDQWM